MNIRNDEPSFLTTVFENYLNENKDKIEEFIVNYPQTSLVTALSCGVTMGVAWDSKYFKNTNLLKIIGFLCRTTAPGP
jgi:hypothetical protein